MIAANLCFEPTVGLLIRRELLMRSVRFNGDIITQAVSHVAQLEWEWVHGWTAELVQFLLDDETHGAANREVLTGVARRTGCRSPTRRRRRSQPVFDELPAGIAFDDARANVRIDFDALLRGVRRDRAGRAAAGGAR